MALFLAAWGGCASRQGTWVQPEAIAAEDKAVCSAEGRERPERLPARIAVLPFGNSTEEPEIETLVRRSFYHHLSSKRYEDVELFRVDRALGREGLLEGRRFARHPAFELGTLLGADGLIYGTVTACERVFLAAYSHVALRLEVKLVRVSDGEVLWQEEKRTARCDGGLPLSAFSLISAVVRSALNVRDVELLRTANDLSREILSTLPEPCMEQQRATAPLDDPRVPEGGKSRSAPLSPLEENPRGAADFDGCITEDTVWSAGKSPYVLRQTVQVAKGVTLTIEPGTVIQSTGPGIVVRGVLRAVGEPQKNVIFSALRTTQKDLLWEGITFDGTGESGTLRLCEIRDARTALTLIASSPRVRECVIRGNERGLDLREGSRPLISSNTIMENRKEGIRCDRSSPAIRDNRVALNGGGILVRQGDPEIEGNRIMRNDRFELTAFQEDGRLISARGNLWSSPRGTTLVERVRGPVLLAPVLERRRGGTGGPPVVLLPASRTVTGEARHLAVARSLLARKRYTEAARAAAIVVDADPDHAEALFLLGIASDHAGHPEAAGRFLTRAADLRPEKDAYRVRRNLIGK